MAEQEVIKHTKQVYKIWTSKTHSFWHKLKEFAIEIVIIVFAVGMTVEQTVRGGGGAVLERVAQRTVRRRGGRGGRRGRRRGRLLLSFLLVSEQIRAGDRVGKQEPADAHTIP